MLLDYATAFETEGLIMEQFPLFPMDMPANYRICVLGDMDSDYAERFWGMAPNLVEQSGEPIGTRLRLQARMGIGSALISNEKYKDAAEVYKSTAPLAEKLEDKNMQLECWRMASYCYEIEKDHKLALECGMKALNIGETMKSDDRKHSTLSYAGEGMMRLTTRNKFVGLKQFVEKKMVELLGTDWQPNH